MKKIDPLPRHIAVIMDGNGRWATTRGLARSEGHAKGVETLRNTLKLCKEYGINYLTAYAFSTENWKRPAAEVNTLMLLLGEYLKQETEKLYSEKIQLRIIGDTTLMPAELQQALQQSVDYLAVPEHERVLTLALSYGGRNEIIRAVKAIADDLAKSKITPNDITEDNFDHYLDTSGIPDPDLLIRTAGELRLSNFLLWQLSYAELYATPTLWPDFSETDFREALLNYSSRTRKFGNVSPLEENS